MCDTLLCMLCGVLQIISIRILLKLMMREDVRLGKELPLLIYCVCLLPHFRSEGAGVRS